MLSVHRINRVVYHCIICKYTNCLYTLLQRQNGNKTSKEHKKHFKTLVISYSVSLMHATESRRQVMRDTALQ